MPRGNRTYLSSSERILTFGKEFLFPQAGTDDYNYSLGESIPSALPVSSLGVCDMALKHNAKPDVNALPDVHPWHDPEFMRDYPSIYAFLYDLSYEGGRPRKPGTISLFVKAEGLTWAVNDHDRDVVAFVNRPTWAEALDVMEVGISNDTLGWKARRSYSQKPGIPF